MIAIRKWAGLIAAIVLFGMVALALVPWMS